jgi:hypothetical protein
MEHEIETVLRAAPKPTPPAGLKERLIAQVRLAAVRPASQTLANSLAPAGWLRRWWPVLAPAAVSLACAVGLTMQQMEIRDLRQAILDLSRDSAAKAGALSTPTVQTNDAASEAEVAARTQQEIARLKALASQLGAEVAQLEQMRAENAKLRTQLAAPPAGFLTPEETQALANAKERAVSHACLNNMQKLGLAMRAWALDNGNVFPPDILSVTNKLGTPKVLVCPADQAREPAKDWASYTPAHCSYEYLAPSASDKEPLRVLFRCPIHGHVSLCDGMLCSGPVQGELHPTRVVQRDGKLYLDDSPEPAQAAPAPQFVNPPPGGSKP